MPKQGQNRVVSRLGCENQQQIVKKIEISANLLLLKINSCLNYAGNPLLYSAVLSAMQGIIATGNLLSSVARETKIRCGTITTPTTAMHVLTTKSHGDYELFCAKQLVETKP